jgi:hypothetical protein
VCPAYYFEGYTLTSDDIQTIATIAKILDEIDIDLIKKPKELEDWEFVESLPVECFVP